MHRPGGDAGEAGAQRPAQLDAADRGEVHVSALLSDGVERGRHDLEHHLGGARRQGEARSLPVGGVQGLGRPGAVARCSGLGMSRPSRDALGEFAGVVLGDGGRDLVGPAGRQAGQRVPGEGVVGRQRTCQRPICSSVGNVRGVWLAVDQASSAACSQCSALR